MWGELSESAFSPLIFLTKFDFFHIPHLLPLYPSISFSLSQFHFFQVHDLYTPMKRTKSTAWKRTIKEGKGERSSAVNSSSLLYTFSLQRTLQLPVRICPFYSFLTFHNSFLSQMSRTSINASYCRQQQSKQRKSTFSNFNTTPNFKIPSQIFLNADLFTINFGKNRNEKKRTNWSNVYKQIPKPCTFYVIVHDFSTMKTQSGRGERNGRTRNSRLL